jgi:acetolactate synthase-1/2/3 large subunit
MNGADSLIHTLAAAGVDVCFANPGTSEMHFVAALDRVEAVRPVLGLFEGVVTGAADGYGRIAGKTAAALLHLGPGLANGIANLHNARRAASPILAVVGEHASGHRALDAPLTMDIESLARPVSKWLGTAAAGRVGADTATALAAARNGRPGISTLILPADAAWQDGDAPADVAAPTGRATVDDGRIAEIAGVLQRGEPAVLLMTGSTLLDRGLAAAGNIAGATGAALMCNTFNGRVQRGGGRLRVARLPYFGELAVEALAPYAHIVLVENQPPVSFFAYPGKPSSLVPEGSRVHVLAGPEEDGCDALERLADLVGARTMPEAGEPRRPELPTGPLDVKAVWQTVGAFMPEGAIVSDECGTSARGADGLTAGSPPHDWLHLTGGSIGQAGPVAAGAAIARPGATVFCMQGDGGAMYTLQALWTQARERLDVVTVIFANRSYEILKTEFKRVGVHDPGPRAMSMLDLDNPALDWVALAQGMGVAASRPATADAFAAGLSDALAAGGPHLFEVRL